MLFLFIFASCSPSTQDSAEMKEEAISMTNIVGMWDTGENIYNFYEDGRFETVNNLALSGYSWRLEKDKLILSFLDSPANKAIEEVYILDTVRTARLILISSDDSKLTWNRSKENAQAVEAELFYRERIALPPEILVRYELSQETQKGKHIVNSSYFSYKGTIPLPLKAFYLEKNRDKNLPLMLSVTFYYKDNALFSTKEPVIIDESNQKVLLMRVTNEEISPPKILAPQAFTFTREEEDAFYYAKLFLENKHLFFLIQERDEKNDGIDEKEAYLTWGYWNQVGRGHSLELIVAGKETLTGAVHLDNSLFFDNLPLFEKVDRIKLLQTQESMNEKLYFTIKGIVTKKNDDFFLVPQGLTESFKLLGNVLVNPQLSSLKNNESLFIELNASYSLEGYFDVQNIISTSKIQSSTENTQGTNLKNTYWRLTELNAKEKIPQSPAEPHFILKIEDESAKSGDGAGSDGCNSFFFTWKADKDMLDISLGGSTMRLCPEEHVEEQAREYLKVLDTANKYNIQGSSLELKKDDKTLARFESVAL